MGAIGLIAVHLNPKAMKVLGILMGVLIVVGAVGLTIYYSFF